MIIREKYAIRLFFIFTLILLGGCTLDQKNEEQQIVNKATETTIQYFKEKENLDVVITKHKFAPKDFQSVWVSGHVKDDKNKNSRQMLNTLMIITSVPFQPRKILN